MASNNKTLILLVAVSVLGSLGAAAGTGFFFMSRARSGAAPPSEKSEEHTEKKSHAKLPETVCSLGEMVINLSDSGDLRYVKISIAIGLEEKLEPEAIKASEPILKDAIIHVVSSRHFAELHRPGGLDKLKADLKEAMDGKIAHATLAEVYLESFAMQ